MDVTTLYNAVRAAEGNRPRSVRDMSPEDRRAYERTTRKAHRDRQKLAAAEGSPLPTEDVLRQALSDAAIILLATGAPGSDALTKLLAKAFPGRPGVPGTVRARARSGGLRPKLITPERLAPTV